MDYASCTLEDHPITFLIYTLSRNPGEINHLYKPEKNRALIIKHPI